MNFSNFIAELIRNSTGYFLVTVGLLAMVLAGHTHNDLLADAGKGLVGAALLAFQSKRSPDGNTTTMQVTTPPPFVPPTPVLPDASANPTQS